MKAMTLCWMAKRRTRRRISSRVITSAVPELADGTEERKRFALFWRKLEFSLFSKTIPPICKFA